MPSVGRHSHSAPSTPLCGCPTDHSACIDAALALPAAGGAGGALRLWPPLLIEDMGDCPIELHLELAGDDAPMDEPPDDRRGEVIRETRLPKEADSRLFRRMRGSTAQSESAPCSPRQGQSRRGWGRGGGRREKVSGFPRGTANTDG